MVEASSDFKKGLDIKLSLDLTAQGKSPVIKRVLASDYDTLMSQSKKLAVRHGLSEAECQLKYFDGDSMVVVEDNDDLDLAFAIAQTSDNKLTFTIKHPDVASAPAEKTMGDVVMKEEKQKKAKKEMPKGIPRKALKNLINSELDRQAQEVFQKLRQVAAKQGFSTWSPKLTTDLLGPELNKVEAITARLKGLGRDAAKGGAKVALWNEPNRCAW